MKAKRKKYIIGGLVGLITIVGILPMILSCVAYEMNFGGRFETGPSYAYQTEEFEGLEREEHEFVSGQGAVLMGYHYYTQTEATPKALVVLAHGFGGGGHTSYIPEINYLVQNGYQVFTYDITGNDVSEGKSVRGLPQGVLDLEQALYFVQGQDQFKGLPIMLYGHSWGAYSVMTELNNEFPITAVVAASGFNKPTDLIIEQGVKIYGGSIKVLEPYIKLYEKIKFGKTANLTSIDGLKKTTAQVLLIHSEDDPVISFENSFAYFKEALKGKDNIQFLPMTNRGHEFARSPEVQEQLKEINNEMKALKEQYGSLEAIPDEVRTEIYTRNKSMCKQIDKEIMDKIVSFYDKAIS